MKGEKLHMKPSAGPCEIHEWPTHGIAHRLVVAMRDRHGKGGINACRDCLARAKEDAERLRAALNGLRLKGDPR